MPRLKLLCLAWLLSTLGCSTPGNSKGAPSPQAQRTAAKSADVKVLLDRISSWYGANSPKGTCRFAPPASAEDFASAESKLGRALPDDVRALYQVANGTQGTGVFYGYLLFSLEELCDETQFWEGLAESAWNQGQGWLPLTGNGGGDHHCRDTRGQIFSFSHETGREGDGAPSLHAWLEEFASELESGGWIYSEEDEQIVRREFVRGEFVRYAKGSLHLEKRILTVEDPSRELLRRLLSLEFGEQVTARLEGDVVVGIARSPTPRLPLLNGLAPGQLIRLKSRNSGAAWLRFKVLAVTQDTLRLAPRVGPKTYEGTVHLELRDVLELELDKS